MAHTRNISRKIEFPLRFLCDNLVLLKRELNSLLDGTFKVQEKRKTKKPRRVENNASLFLENPDSFLP